MSRANNPHAGSRGAGQSEQMQVHSKEWEVYRR